MHIRHAGGHRSVPLKSAGEQKVARQTGGWAVSHRTVDEDSLGQHYIPLKPNSMSPQTLQPPQSHPCLFQGLDMIFPSPLLHYSLCWATSATTRSQAESVVPKNTPCSQIWEGQHVPHRDVAQTSCICRKNVLLSSPPVLPLASLPRHHHWLGDTGLDILLTHLALSNLDKKLTFLPLLKTLEHTNFESFKESRGNSSHPDNILFLFGDLLFVSSDLFLLQLKHLLRFWAFLPTQLGIIFFFFHLTVLVNAVATQMYN